jgi:NADH-quinone oxidoreductase subunit H
MVEIVEAQKETWFLFKCPLGFLLFLIAGTAELNRAPFDIPEAESELIAGFHTEYSGMKFAMFFLGEYAAMFIMGVCCTTLFLGGWNGLPWIGSLYIPPIAWFLIKCYAIVFFLMWMRWTYPRVRVDQLMGLSWKFLVPLGFVNIFITSFVVLLT